MALLGSMCLLLMSHGTTKTNGCMLCKRRATRKRLQEFYSLCRMIKGICRMASIASFSLFNYVDVLLTHRRKQVSAELIRILNYLYWPSSSSKPLTLSTYFVNPFHVVLIYVSLRTFSGQYMWWLFLSNSRNINFCSNLNVMR